jgi:carbonic anhydrase/acetyltransferase-like protein (isoleucine patch superfamily)
MPIYQFEGKRPKIGASSWVHPTAVIIGNVTIGERCWIGPNATLRADSGTIRIGDGTNLQDNVVVHGLTATIGSFCTVGHSAVVHGCTVGDHVLVAMNATVLDGAQVGDWCTIAAGSVVAPRAVIPAYKMVMGVPGSVVGDIPKDRPERFNPDTTEGYLSFPYRYPAGIVELTLEEVQGKAPAK